MTKKKFRLAVKEFIARERKPVTGKYVLLERIWNRLLVVVPETFVWIVGFLTGNAIVVVLVHLVIICAVFYWYEVTLKGK